MMWTLGLGDSFKRFARRDSEQNDFELDIKDANTVMEEMN